MNYNINWSENAQNDYFDIMDYLIFEWGNKSAKKFKDNVSQNLALIEKQPKLNALSEIKKDLRRCVIVKQTSMYYLVDEANLDIYIVRFLNNRKSLNNVREALK